MYVCTLFNSIRALNGVVEARGYGFNGSSDVNHSRSTVDCNCTTFRPRRSSLGTKGSFRFLCSSHLAETSVVKMLYNNNLLCYVNA